VGFFISEPRLCGVFFRPHRALLLGYTMRKLRELLEWIFIAMDVYALIDMVIDFIQKHL
jgi:hypothetical protein